MTILENKHLLKLFIPTIIFFLNISVVMFIEVYLVQPFYEQTFLLPWIWTLDLSHFWTGHKRWLTVGDDDSSNAKMIKSMCIAPWYGDQWTSRKQIQQQPEALRTWGHVDAVELRGILSAASRTPLSGYPSGGVPDNAASLITTVQALDFSELC